MEAIDDVFELDRDIDPQKICRLCLSQTNTMYNVFAKSIVDGYMISLPNIFAYTLDINVQKEDQMPTQICSECKQLLISYYLFKQKSKRTEEALQITFGNSLTVVDQVTCSQCEQCFDNEEEFDAHTQNGQCMNSADTTNLIDDLEGIEKCMDSDNQTEHILFEVADIGDNSHESSNLQDSDSHEIEPPAKKSKISSSTDHSDEAGPTKKFTKRATRSSTRLIEKESTQSDDDDYMEYVDDDDDSYVDCGSVDDEDPLLDFQFLQSHSRTSADMLECPVSGGGGGVGGGSGGGGSGGGGGGGNGGKENFFCAPCNKKLRSSLQVEQHTKMHSSMSLIINYIDFYPCHECRMIFISGEKMAAHMNDCHQIEEKQTTEKKANSSLDKIDDSCTDYQFLEDDRDDNEYKDGAYSCGDCKLAFPSANELKYHVILHANKFQCPIFECGCQYNQLSRLSIHVINKHINAKLRKCLHCGKPFDTFDDLQLHLKIDCREKKFECHHCDKKFFSKKALVTHLRTIRVKRFECKICGKKFKQRGELVIHTRTHTNERPFQCTICSKTYKTSSMRAAHMDSHISGKTFECTMCDQKLQSRTSYRNHMKRHTEEKKHECDVCGKKFFTKYHQKLHASKVHVNVSNVTNVTTETLDIKSEHIEYSD